MPDAARISSETRDKAPTPVLPEFASLLRSEWTKLRSVRSTWITAFLAVALSTGVAGLSAFGLGMTYDGQETSFDPLLHLNLGLLIGVMPLKVLGVIAATSEYSSGMIRTTFITTPQRLRVLFAKATVVSGVGIVIATIMVVGMYVTSQLIRSYFELETASVWEREALWFLAAYAVGGLVYVLVPFGLGFLLRSTASALTLSIVMFFLPGMIGATMPRWIQENVLRFLPDVALDSLAGSISTDSAVYLSKGPAFMVIAAWIILTFLVASALLRYRDA